MATELGMQWSFCMWIVATISTVGFAVAAEIVAAAKERKKF